MPPSTAKPPHRFDAGRRQLSIGACRRGLQIGLHSSIEQHTFCGRRSGKFVEHGLVEALAELLVLMRE